MSFRVDRIGTPLFHAIGQTSVATTGALNVNGVATAQWVGHTLTGVSQDRNADFGWFGTSNPTISAGGKGLIGVPINLASFLPQSNAQVIELGGTFSVQCESSLTIQPCFLSSNAAFNASAWGTCSWNDEPTYLKDDTASTLAAGARVRSFSWSQRLLFRGQTGGTLAFHALAIHNHTAGVLTLAAPRGRFSLRTLQPDASVTYYDPKA